MRGRGGGWGRFTPPWWGMPQPGPSDGDHSGPEQDGSADEDFPSGPEFPNKSQWMRVSLVHL